MTSKLFYPLIILMCLPLLLPAQRKNKKFEALYGREDYRKDIRLSNASNINTDGMEFSPVLYGNGIVYVSRRKNGPIDENTGQTFYELFYAEADPNGQPLKGQNFSVEINSHLHEGPVSFNRQGNEIFFTRSNQRQGLSKADKKGRVRLKIYKADKGYFDWENIEELPFNDNSYSCLHPALSADGKRLFFASDKPGGFGGMDIYFVERTSRGWSAPINLGPEINTPKNEVFPFSHESGTLFFASDGHQGLGGLDIFMIDLSDRKWGRVINLGLPFNSEKDDLGLVLRPDGTRGYFTSNRERDNRGQDDVYLFDAPSGLKGIELPETNNTLVSVYDVESSRRILGAGVRVYPLSADGMADNDELYDLEMLPNEKGEVSLTLVRKKDEELGDPQYLTNRNGEAVVPFEVGKSFLVIVTKRGYKTKEIKFTSPDQLRVRPLEVLMEPNNCLTLNGDVIVDAYKVPVTNARVQITNECNGKVSITHTDIEGKFEHCLEIGCNFGIRVIKEGYEEGWSSVSTEGIRGNRYIAAEISMKVKSLDLLKEPISVGTVIILENIYYDFNKSAIRSGEARDLEALAKLMKRYPSMEVELGAHTDSRGENDYNLKLSLKRAESAKRFLLRQGIKSHRIQVFGYGEAYPRNHCVDGTECDEQEHSFNRRTEVKVTKIDESVRLEFKSPDSRRN